MADQTIAALRAIHGLFNFSVALLFVYQASLGLKIRRGRKDLAVSSKAVIRHRRNGPIWAVSGLIGYSAGLVLVYLDIGRFGAFPPHFLLGSMIVLAITAAFIISRKIDAAESWRNRHLAVGILILALYTFQVLIGIAVLRSLSG